MAQHYFEAGKILDKMMAAGAKPFSLKKMLYAKSDKKVSLGAVFALVSETLKCMSITHHCEQYFVIFMLIKFCFG